mmetsp:Transcript_34435/g.68094  ORF Transcript_34435/g.68094 Transcript_34435/m.68094 type:complete len:227 (+) Transcript_34435:704-1384(+)
MADVCALGCIHRGQCRHQQSSGHSERGSLRPGGREGSDLGVHGGEHPEGAGAGEDHVSGWTAWGWEDLHWAVCGQSSEQKILQILFGGPLRCCRIAGTQKNLCWGHARKNGSSSKEHSSRQPGCSFGRGRQNGPRLQGRPLFCSVGDFGSEPKLDLQRSLPGRPIGPLQDPLRVHSQHIRHYSSSSSRPDGNYSDRRLCFPGKDEDCGTIPGPELLQRLRGERRAD